MSNQYLDWLEDLKNSPVDSEDYTRYLNITYPYLIPRNSYGEIDYEAGSMFDLVPKGWRAMFLEMCDEINAILDKHNFCDTENFYFADIKEKFGMLRCYFILESPESNAFKVAQEILDCLYKYEDLSTNYCVECGAPSEYVSKGWVRYYCKNCTPSTRITVDKWREFCGS
jgi:NADH pyrophosphatase NudC (nudix superfamily)